MFAGLTFGPERGTQHDRRDCRKRPDEQGGQRVQGQVNGNSISGSRGGQALIERTGRQQQPNQPNPYPRDEPAEGG